MSLSIRRTFALLIALLALVLVVEPIPTADAVTGTFNGCSYSATSGDYGYAWARTIDQNNNCRTVKARVKYRASYQTCDWGVYTSWDTDGTDAYKTTSYGYTDCWGNHQVQSYDPLAWKTNIYS